MLLRCMNELSKNIIIQYKPIIILLLMKNKDEKTIGNFHVIFYFPVGMASKPIDIHWIRTISQPY